MILEAIAPIHSKFLLGAVLELGRSSPKSLFVLWKQKLWELKRPGKLQAQSRTGFLEKVPPGLATIN
jgi:hypothetical protein